MFNSIYPGCIAETNLFREKRQWFRDIFPRFMKVIGAYVSEEEAGRRLAQVPAPMWLLRERPRCGVRLRLACPRSRPRNPARLPPQRL